MENTITVVKLDQIQSLMTMIFRAKLSTISSQRLAMSSVKVVALFWLLREQSGLDAYH